MDSLTSPLSESQSQEIALDFQKRFEQTIDAASTSCIDADGLCQLLARFLTKSQHPDSLVDLLSDETVFQSLIKVFTTNGWFSNRLFQSPDQFRDLWQSEGRPVDQKRLTQALQTELSQIDNMKQAGDTIRQFIRFETNRIAYGEFVRSMNPETVGQQLAYVAEAVVDTAIDFVIRIHAMRRGHPELPSGRKPTMAVIALGNFGAKEMSYGDSVPLIFLYDQINELNPTHRSFFNGVVRDFVDLIGSDRNRRVGFDVDMRYSPMQATGTAICSLFDAIRIFESSGQTWQRMSLIKARVVAGTKPLGEAFMQRLEPWIYRRFVSRNDLAEIRSFQHRLKRRTGERPEPQEEESESKTLQPYDVVRTPGGRQDIERTIQFLQLWHGGDLQSVRTPNTYEGITALERSGCITHQESMLLSENFARLCRLQHQLAVNNPAGGDRIPADPAKCQLLAWQLGVRDAQTGIGEPKRLLQQLEEVFDVNCRMINHLMLEAPDDGSDAAAESELMLDPDPGQATIEKTLGKHGFRDPMKAYGDMISLSTESVAFLSPHRCRHFFSSLAPKLLSEVAATPFPDRTLASMVKVTDSLGAKATLWELLGTNQPTMELMVRLAAAAPYLIEILTDNPGMIDELIDSLLMDRLPSREKLDAQSIELCRGAEDINPILLSFKHSAHLTIGVRNLLGKETLSGTQTALGDTAEACLRRVVQYEHEQLAARYGDPVAEDGTRAEMITVGLGKLGGREPNYHSDLDAVFLYSNDGETQRRVGGPRSTLTNRNFFNQLASRVLDRVNTSSPRGRLYELDGRLRPTGDEGVIAVSVEDFLNRFRSGSAPLWQWIALIKARAISGSREHQKTFDHAVADLIAGAECQPKLADEIWSHRLRMEETATPENLKRGEGGTVDIELIAQTLVLRYAAERPEVLHTNTVTMLNRLAEAEFLPEEEALQLIAGYQTLRAVEINLRLMKTQKRHELPDDEESLRTLAFLMKEDDPAMIQAACSQVRQRNRRLFNQILERLRG